MKKKLQKKLSNSLETVETYRACGCMSQSCYGCTGTTLKTKQQSSQLPSITADVLVTIAQYS